MQEQVKRPSPQKGTGSFPSCEEVTAPDASKTVDAIDDALKPTRPIWECQTCKSRSDGKGMLAGWCGVYEESIIVGYE